MANVRRREGRPGVIKIEVSSKVQKIKILRAKRNLKDKERYIGDGSCNPTSHWNRDCMNHKQLKYSEP